VGGVDLSRGESGTRGTPADREREAEAGARLLGLQFRENLGLPDGGIVPSIHARDLVIDAIRRHRPQLVVAPYPQDDHPDHTHAGQLVKDARFLAGCARIGPPGEPWRPGRVLFYPSRQLLMPSLIVDITDVFEQKLAAMRAHGSQLHDPRSREPLTTISSPDFLPAVEAGNRHYGDLIGVRFGEAYVVEGPLAIADPVPVVRDRTHGRTGPGALAGSSTGDATGNSARAARTPRA
jgi:bacillithiol biosynthesis deacetylase BshB1